MLGDFIRVTFVEPHDGRHLLENPGLRAAAETRPTAIPFKYHLPYTRHLGEIEMDADIAGPVEAQIVAGPVKATSRPTMPDAAVQVLR
jgi:hypothetical protein